MQEECAFFPVSSVEVKAYEWDVFTESQDVCSLHRSILKDWYGHGASQNTRVIETNMCSLSENQSDWNLTFLRYETRIHKSSYMY